MKGTEKIALFQNRFNGRKDVYGKKWYSKDKDGKPTVGYAPVCENLWKDFCHLKLKDGVTCGNCKNRKNTPVSDASVTAHITADEEHLHYMLLEDGTINFAAIDFDYKEGKEAQGHIWKDVKLVSTLLDKWKIPHGIARSTGQGYHIYFFFNKGRCPANLLRSLLFEIYDKAGFILESREGIRPMPEMFPKQSWAGEQGIGNGIKPPMIESKWKMGKNGFVDKEGIFLPPDEQWEYLNSIPRISKEFVQSLLDEHKIMIIEENAAASAVKSSSSVGVAGRSGKGKWQPPLAGSVDKLLEGCQALRAIRDKCKAGKVPSHHEGMMLWHACMAVADGEKWFLEHVPGWAKTDHDLKQLKYSTEKNYTPHTCVRMQQDGVCRKGTKCFNKKPPKETIEGRLVVRSDVPRDQWPEPSPMRYAYGSGEDFLLKVIREVDDLKLQIDPQLRTNSLSDLVYRAQVFDDDQLKTFKAHTKKQKLVSATELNEMFNIHEESRNSEADANLDRRSDTVRVNEFVFQRIEPRGYSVIKRIRGKMKTLQLCSFDIQVEEQRVYQDDGEILKSVYVGTCSANNMSAKFEIENSKWYDNAKFNEFFGQKLGEAFLIHKQDLEHIRMASMKFSSMDGIEKSSFIMTQGWYGNTYVMPSVIVDKDGIRPNTEQKIDLSQKQVARALDFQILSEDDFRSTLMHLKSDFLNAWPNSWAAFALSHSFMAGTMKHLGIRKKPSLFFEGLTGSGKTELMQTIAFLWGDFRRIPNLSSTGLGIQEAAYNFKDALLVVDDYKGATRAEKQALERSIQYSYDEGSIRLKQNRDGGQAAAKDSRALFMFTGEEFLSSDSAKVSRCILIDVEKHDISKTKEKYMRCIERRNNYSGVMPKFLHWFLTKDHAVIKQRMNDLEDELYAKSTGKTNAQRIAYNLSRSMGIFELFCEFLKFHGVAGDQECQDMLSKHMQEVYEVNHVMVQKCEESQNGAVFGIVLRQMIESGELSITDLKGYDRPHKPTVGFARSSNDGKAKVYLYPIPAFREVMKYAKDSHSLTGTQRSITRQLISLGLIKESGNRSTSVVREGEKVKRAWELDMVKLGLFFDNEEVPVNDQ